MTDELAEANEEECGSQKTEQVQEKECEKTNQEVKTEKTRDPEPTRGRLKQTLKKDEFEPRRESVPCERSRDLSPEETQVKNWFCFGDVCCFQVKGANEGVDCEGWLVLIGRLAPRAYPF